MNRPAMYEFAYNKVKFLTDSCLSQKKCVPLRPNSVHAATMPFCGQKGMHIRKMKETVGCLRHNCVPSVTLMKAISCMMLTPFCCLTCHTMNLQTTDRQLATGGNEVADGRSAWA